MDLSEVSQSVENKNRRKIEIFFAKTKRATTNQIAKDTGLSWSTVQVHLKDMEAVGRVDVERIGNAVVYTANGKGSWNKRVHLSKNKILFLDTFFSQYGPFLRIKEVRRDSDQTHNWEKVGEIMITKEKLAEVRQFIEKLESKIKQHEELQKQSPFK